MLKRGRIKLLQSTYNTIAQNLDEKELPEDDKNFNDLSYAEGLMTGFLQCLSMFGDDIYFEVVGEKLGNDTRTKD